MLLCGPTVKRLRREREARERERRSERRRSRAPSVRWPRPHPRPQTSQRRLVHTQPRQPRKSPTFPLSMAALLELERVPDVVVLDGRIRQIRWGLAGPGEPGVEMSGCCRKTRDCGLLHERLTRAMQTERTALEAWIRSTGVNWKRADDFDDLPGTQPTADVGGVEEFLFSRLIPLLKQKSCGYQEERPAASSQVPKEVAFPGLERRFAFIGRRWHALVPFFGAPGLGQFQLRLGDDQFIGIRVEERQKKLERYDAMLQEAVRQACPRPAKQRTGRTLLFQDETYAVVATPRDRYFLCRHIPPYVVEGPDRKLYFFEEVEVGIQIAHTDIEQLIQPRKAKVMHPYRHMFLSDSGTSGAICMPRPETYYRELHRLTLEEALLHHLEAARLTLCAGYTPASTPHHSIHFLNRRTLREEEALERGLPIYHYYRGGKDESSVWEAMLEMLSE